MNLCKLEAVPDALNAVSEPSSRPAWMATQRRTPAPLSRSGAYVRRHRLVIERAACLPSTVNVFDLLRTDVTDSSVTFERAPKLKRLATYETGRQVRQAKYCNDISGTLTDDTIFQSCLNGSLTFFHCLLLASLTPSAP